MMDTSDPHTVQPGTSTEAELVRDCIAGNQRAFADLVDGHKAMVYSLVHKAVGDPNVTDDLSQEVFMRVHRGLPAFRGESKLSTWIYRIAYRVCLEELKRPHRRHPVMRLDAAPDEPGAIPEAAWSQDADVGQVELQKDLAHWMGDLLPHYRIALTLFYLQDRRYSEIAEVMRLPEGTVKTYLHRAKQVLRDRMLKEEGAVR